jgi:hypothetical protein
LIVVVIGVFSPRPLSSINRLPKLSHGRLTQRENNGDLELLNASNAVLWTGTSQNRGG